MIQEGKNYGEYKFGGSTYFQYPLVAGQKLEVMRVILGAMAKAKEIPDSPINGIKDLLTSDFIAEFIGIVLISSAETQKDLAKVKDFLTRGKELLFSMDNGEKEVLEDFFTLNRSLIEEMLQSLFGMSISDLTVALSAALTKISESSSISSLKDGQQTPSA